MTYLKKHPKTIAFLLFLTLFWLVIHEWQPRYNSAWENLVFNLTDPHTWDHFFEEIIVLGILVLGWEELHSRNAKAEAEEERSKTFHQVLHLMNFLFVDPKPDQPQSPLRKTPMGSHLADHDDPHAKHVRAYAYDGEPLFFHLDIVVEQIRAILHENYSQDFADIYSSCRTLHFLNARHFAIGELLRGAEKNSREYLELKLNRVSMRLSILLHLRQMKDKMTSIEDFEIAPDNYRLVGPIKKRLLNSKYRPDQSAYERAFEVLGKKDEIYECYAHTQMEFIEAHEQLEKFEAA